jgi:hypothetical protein
MFCILSVYRQYAIRNNGDLNDNKIKFDESQYNKVERKLISNESSKLSSSQSKSIDVLVILLI